TARWRGRIVGRDESPNRRGADAVGPDKEVVLITYLGAGSLEKVVLLDIGQDVEVQRSELSRRLAKGAAHGRQFAVLVIEVVEGQHQLTQVVAALRAGRGLAHLGDGGQQQCKEHSEEREQHQELKQGEAATRLSRDVGHRFVLSEKLPSYQSAPSISPPLGVQAAHQVWTLILSETVRTPESARQTWMPAGCGDCGRAGLQSAAVGV